jgi:hypothetical protein
MDAPLAGHAHHHCHVLMNAGGADSAFTVRGERVPVTDDCAVLVNAWEHHAYVHAPPPGVHTLILALYIEPGWLTLLQRSLALSGDPRFFPQSCVRRGVCGSSVLGMLPEIMALHVRKLDPGERLWQNYNQSISLRNCPSGRRTFGRSTSQSCSALR